MILTQDEMEEINETVEAVHQEVEHILENYLPTAMLLIARTSILCPTCREKAFCMVADKYSEMCKDTWERVFANRREVVGNMDMGGIAVPSSMLDMERES